MSPTAPAPVAADVGDFFALMKPRVMFLVVFTGLVGLVLAPGHIHPVTGFTAILCIAVGAGASGVINMWFDRDIDAIMTRTSTRPIPGGRVDPGEALSFGVFMAGASVLVMGLGVNLASALLLAFSIFFYVAIYTMWLKRRTAQNIVIGGAAGAFPPMIGWMAVTGDTSIVPLVLFAIIFLWTPPHFWALALYRSEDYERAGVPMLPVVKGPRETKRQILLYTLIMLPVTELPYFLGACGPIYALAAAVLGGLFLLSAIQVYRMTEAARDKPAKQLFAYSILYLFVLFAVMMVDHGVIGAAWSLTP